MEIQKYILQAGWIVQKQFAKTYFNLKSEVRSCIFVLEGKWKIENNVTFYFHISKYHWIKCAIYSCILKDNQKWFTFVNSRQKKLKLQFNILQLYINVNRLIPSHGLVFWIILHLAYWCHRLHWPQGWVLALH